MKKRILASLLAVVLLISVLPAQAAISSFTCDIADGSWVSIDESLRLSVKMPDLDGTDSSYSKVYASVNGCEVSVNRDDDKTVALVIPQGKLLPGENTVSFKAVDADGNQVGETHSITINGFKALNSTVISETDFNNVTDAYNKSYEATLASDGWTYADWEAQGETKTYLSPEVLYGCSTMELKWASATDASHIISRVSHTDNPDDKYLQYTANESVRTDLNLVLANKEHTYPGKIMRVSMDVYTEKGADTIANASTFVQDGLAGCKLQPFNGVKKGWVHVVAYFDPNKSSAIAYRYDNEGNLLYNTRLGYNSKTDGVSITKDGGKFGFLFNLKAKGGNVGFDNVKFEYLDIGHYDDFSVTMSETETDGVYADSAAMTIIAYGEGAKVYIDGVQAVANSTDGAIMVYNIDGSIYDYGRKNIRVDYKKENNFESVYKNLLIKQSAETNGNYVNQLTYETNPGTGTWPGIAYNVLLPVNVTDGVAMQLGASNKPLSNTTLEVLKNGEDVSGQYKATFKPSSGRYLIQKVSAMGAHFDADSYYKVTVGVHSIYFYTPGDSGAYLKLYDAQLGNGEFSVRAEKAASAPFDNAAKLIVAVYNNDELVGINVKDLDNKAGVSADGVSVKYAGNATNAKAFILDGLDSIKPLITNIEVE